MPDFTGMALLEVTLPTMVVLCELMAVCRKVCFLAVDYWLTLLLSMEPRVKGETGPRGLL